MSVSIADQVSPELPYLRRFARALTGSQQRGDSYVVAMLEAIVADQRTFRTDLSPRTAVYEAFLKIWSALPLNQIADHVHHDPRGVADRRIETLTPKPRQAFLLASVEQFTATEIGAILGTTAEQAAELIATAGREISEQIAARVLIIEDEPLIALELETIVTEIGHEVVGMARTRSEAKAVADKQKPGLVLADIQLADGSSGIDAVNDIVGDGEVPVIFITAYPERLLTGERTEPTYLIPKPFRPDMLKAVISQALFFDVKAKRAMAG